MLITEEMDRFLDELPSDNYFAYIGLTTKIENPFRDKFAYYLHKKYSNELLIAREHMSSDAKRIDLAVLNKENQKIIDTIEFKACYAFDIVRRKKKKKDIEDDYIKYSNLNIDFNQWFILISVRTNNKTKDIYSNIIKYHESQNKLFNRIPYCFDQYKKEVENIKNWFHNNENIQLKYCKEKPIGESFETKVFLDYFIFKRNK